VSGKLRVGVIGCGGIAQMMHLPTLAERPDLFEIAAIGDISEATLAAVGGSRRHSDSLAADSHCAATRRHREMTVR